MADDIRKCGDLDERLAAYVDGEDAPPAHRAVESHLAGCPPCREDAVAESTARTLVRGHKQTLSDRAPEALRARCAASLRPPASGSRLFRLPSSVFRLSAAAAIVLAVAGVFLFGLNNSVEALAASLAADHIKCFKVGGLDHEVQPAVVEQAWRQDQGWEITVPPAAAAEQLTLVSLRRCYTTDGRSAHAMYLWRGAPISMYILPEALNRQGVSQKLGTEAVIWSANGRTYAVVADGHPADLTRIVDYLKARVR